MKFFSQQKRLKKETKNLHLAYYNGARSVNSFEPIKIFWRRFKKPLKIILIFLLLGLITLLGFYIFQKSTFLKITEVNIIGQNKYVALSDVQSIANNSLIGKPFFKIDTIKTSENIKKNFLGAQDVFVTLKWPNKCVIQINERNPVAVIIDSEKKKFLVDKEGYVMGEVTDSISGYPELTYSDRITIGQFVAQSMVSESVKVISYAKEVGLVINNIQFTSQYITLLVNGNIEVDLSLAKDNLMALKQVGAILKKVDSDGKKLRKVDLRYEKVIVLYD